MRFKKEMQQREHYPEGKRPDGLSLLTKRWQQKLRECGSGNAWTGVSDMERSAGGEGRKNTDFGAFGKWLLSRCHLLFNVFERKNRN